MNASPEGDFGNEFWPLLGHFENRVVFIRKVSINSENYREFIKSAHSIKWVYRITIFFYVPIYVFYYVVLPTGIVEALWGQLVANGGPFLMWFLCSISCVVSLVVLNLLELVYTIWHFFKKMSSSVQSVFFWTRRFFIKLDLPVFLFFKLHFYFSCDVVTALWAQFFQDLVHSYA